MPDLVFTKRVVEAKGKGNIVTYQVGRNLKRGGSKERKKKERLILNPKPSNKAEAIISH